MLKTRTTAIKKEIRRALVVQQVGLRRKAVPNAKRVVRGRLVMGVKIVHWVLPETEATTMQRNVNNVNWVKQQRVKVPLNAMLVMLEHLAKPKVSVQHARLASIKTTKAKMNASNAHWESRTSTPKQHAVVVALVRLAATKVFAKHARLRVLSQQTRLSSTQGEHLKRRHTGGALWFHF